ncbi:MAG TPA: hypothetical protein VGL42_14760 [Opitutaceae bacterium]|jgi:hypothetical protein
MNYPLQALLKMGVIPPVALPPDSRYYGSSTLTYTDANGQTITYLAPRYVPQPGNPNYSTTAQHTVKSADRLDLVAATYLGDPLLFWVLCDANGAIDPNELLQTPGATVNITLPQGVPGSRA